MSIQATSSKRKHDTTEPNNQLAQGQSQSKQQCHGLLSLPIEILRNLSDFLAVKDVACTMVICKPSLGRLQPFFTDFGNGTQVWQRHFHERMAHEAPWAALKAIRKNNPIPASALENWYTAIESIISQSGPELVQEKRITLQTLLSNCKNPQDVSSVETTVRNLGILYLMYGSD